MIRFPDDYDPLLGPYKLVLTCAQLPGALKYVLYRRTLIVTGFYDLDLTGVTTISILIFGVVNPNRNGNNPTNRFSFGLLDVDLVTVIEGNFDIPGIIPSLAPEGISLLSIKSTTYKARYAADFTFAFSPL